jgi:prepilin-type N-terminal cleavage/methylation domain-containing protein
MPRKMSSGFTLIEVLIVVVVISIVLICTIVIPIGCKLAYDPTTNDATVYVVKENPDCSLTLKSAETWFTNNPRTFTYSMMCGNSTKSIIVVCERKWFTKTCKME